MLKIDKSFVAPILKKLRVSKRGRSNHNFHKNYSDPVQRFLNVLGRKTYVRPHKHTAGDRVEAFIVLKGRVLVIEYSDKGKVTDYFVLDPAKKRWGAEVSTGVFHNLIPLAGESVLYEIKYGPYEPVSDKHFAPWAPEEGGSAGLLFNKKI